MKQWNAPATGVIERLLLLVGVLMLGRWWMVTQDARAFQTWAAAVVDSIPGENLKRRNRNLEHEIVGRILIPRIGSSALIAEGMAPSTLRRAVGHMPTSALPGEPGNVVLAAHRDTYFKGLGKLRRGDIVRLQTQRRTYRYEIENTQVVDADAVEVMRPTRSPALTLVTCYPFGTLGPAPRRYIVRAHLAGWESDVLAAVK